MQINTSLLLFVTAIFLSACSKPTQDQNNAQNPPNPSEQVQQVGESADSVEALMPSSSEATWQEDVHYRIISEQLSDNREVVEYFSYWCPSCFRFEPLANAISESLSGDVGFRKVHVNFMGFTTPAIQDEATTAMLVARQLGKEKLASAALFSHIHLERKPIESMDDIRLSLINAGIPEGDFDSALESESVAAQFTANNQLLVDNKSYLTGVPNIIVNGKYQAIFTVGMSAQDIITLVNWLSAQP